MKLERISKKNKINAVVEADPRGGYSAFIPSMPGCISEGETISELEKNLQDAVSGWKKANLRFKVENLETFIMPVNVYA
jgi:predicted RNase H-like HicB family nuclease